MRDIRFRAWDTKQKLMFHFHNPDICFEYGYLAWESVEYPGICNIPGMPSIDELELMQFTGLRDKNGKEIYEGDIISWDGHADDPMCRSEIVYSSGCVRAKGFSGGSDILTECSNWPERIEVIGNIHQTPDAQKRGE